MNKELDPVVDKSLEETIHKEAYRLFYFTNAGSSLPISEARKSMQLVAKESKSTAIEDFIKELRAMIEEVTVSSVDEPDNFYVYRYNLDAIIAALKLKIDKGE